MSRARKKPAPALNPFRRWSVYPGLPESARRASAQCIRHHVHEAARDKAESIAALADARRVKHACDISLTFWREAAQLSLHALARKSLEYMRYRAHLASGSGSYAPAGWPIDKPMREKWLALQDCASEAVQ